LRQVKVGEGEREEEAQGDARPVHVSGVERVTIHLGGDLHLGRYPEGEGGHDQDEAGAERAEETRA